MRTRSATPTPPPLLVRRPCGAARRFCARRDSRLRTGRQPRTRVGVRARRLDRLRRGRHWRGMLPAAGGPLTGRDPGMPGRVLEGTDRPGEGGQPLLEATRVRWPGAGECGCRRRRIERPAGRPTPFKTTRGGRRRARGRRGTAGEEPTPAGKASGEPAAQWTDEPDHGRGRMAKRIK